MLKITEAISVCTDHAELQRYLAQISKEASLDFNQEEFERQEASDLKYYILASIKKVKPKHRSQSVAQGMKLLEEIEQHANKHFDYDTCKRHFLDLENSCTSQEG